LMSSPRFFFAATLIRVRLKLFLLKYFSWRFVGFFISRRCRTCEKGGGGFARRCRASAQNGALADALPTEVPRPTIYFPEQTPQRADVKPALFFAATLIRVRLRSFCLWHQVPIVII
jgi:hypothetical protein